MIRLVDDSIFNKLAESNYLSLSSYEILPHKKVTFNNFQSWLCRIFFTLNNFSRQMFYIKRKALFSLAAG